MAARLALMILFALGLAGCQPEPGLDKGSAAAVSADTLTDAMEESGGVWDKVSPAHQRKLVEIYGSEQLARDAIERTKAVKDSQTPLGK